LQELEKRGSTFSAGFSQNVEENVENRGKLLVTHFPIFVIQKVKQFFIEAFYLARENAHTKTPINTLLHRFMTPPKTVKTRRTSTAGFYSNKKQTIRNCF